MYKRIANSEWRKETYRHSGVPTKSWTIESTCRILYRMNRRNVVIGLLLLFIGVLFVFSNLRRTTLVSSNSCKTHHDTYQVISSKFQVPSSKLLVADSPEKWEYGLMNVKSKKDICGHDGMIFTFPIAMPQTFWNKNTLIDLDIYWMNGEKIEGKALLPAITKEGLRTISSPVPVKEVMEIVLE